jgi:dihydrofolate reductase
MMRKIVFGINTTINGFADHTVMIANDELHNFFSDILDKVDVILYGRKTYQLMESFWPIAPNDPECTADIKRFADTINPIKKIVFSNSLTEVNWENSSLASESLIKTVNKLKSEKGRNVAVGSLTLASQLLKQNLIDEFWFAIHPVVAPKGPLLFEGVDVIKKLNFVDSITFSSGVIVHHYQNT